MLAVSSAFRGVLEVVDAISLQLESAPLCSRDIHLGARSGLVVVEVVGEKAEEVWSELRIEG